MSNYRASVGKLGRTLRTNRVAQAAEILVIGLAGLATIIVANSLAADRLFVRHAIIAVGNLLMMLLIWLGLRLRGQSCREFGVTFAVPRFRQVVVAVAQSLAVLAAAVFAVVVAAIVMANIVGIPEGADLSGHNYLRGNPAILVVSLLAVYLNASFGEEWIYRGFLMNRIAGFGAGSRSAWVIAVLLSSLAFGIAHSDWAVTGVVQMTFMGAALGCGYLAVKRNLWVNILAHAYLDTMLLLQIYWA